MLLQHCFVSLQWCEVLLHGYFHNLEVLLMILEVSCLSAGLDGVVLHIGGVFDGLKSIFPAKGECGGQKVEVVHLGVKSSDVGFSNLADADDILNI